MFKYRPKINLSPISTKNFRVQFQNNSSSILIVKTKSNLKTNFNFNSIQLQLSSIKILTWDTYTEMRPRDYPLFVAFLCSIQQVCLSPNSNKLYKVEVNFKLSKSKPKINLSSNLIEKCLSPNQLKNFQSPDLKVSKSKFI